MGEAGVQLEGRLQRRAALDGAIFKISNTVLIGLGCWAPVCQRRLKGNQGCHLKLKWKQNKNKQTGVWLPSHHRFSKKRQ